MMRGAVAKGFLSVNGGVKGSSVKLDGGVIRSCATTACDIDIAVRCVASRSCSIGVAAAVAQTNKGWARALNDSATTPRISPLSHQLDDLPNLVSATALTHRPIKDVAGVMTGAARQSV
jgi:hypothetical protein